MKCVSNRTSGVKYLVSSTVSLLRGVPLSQVKSPNANGVKLSTPVVASGACKASGMDGGAGAGAAAVGCGAGAGAGGGATAAVSAGAAAARACSATSSWTIRSFSAASSSSTADMVESAGTGEVFAAGAGGVSAASRRSTRYGLGVATYTLVVDWVNPSFAAATW